MRQTENTVKIVGYLHSFGEANGRNVLEKKVSGPNSKAPGTEFIGGTVQIAVDEAGLNIIPVHFSYVTSTYAKSGKSNPNFSALQKLITDNKCIVNVGKENAAKVAIDGAIALNDFYTDPEDEKTLVSAKMIEGSFVNIINELPKEEDRHTFKTDMVITKVTHVDADEEKKIEKDFVTIRGAVFNFRNEVLPVEFNVTNEIGMKHFESLGVEDEPVFTKVWGTINCMTTVVTTTEESAFGEASVRSYERKVREWIVTGTAKEAYAFGEEGVLTVEELQKAMGDRQVTLAENRKRAIEFRINKNAPAAAPATPAQPMAKVGGFTF